RGFQPDQAQLQAARQLQACYEALADARGRAQGVYFVGAGRARQDLVDGPLFRKPERAGPASAFSSLHALGGTSACSS
ncbi:hypothetical protein Pgy4_09158, partial [Pseudomonas savastanoi pv. glycinea str. race 4]